MKDLKDLKVGDKVWTIQHGWSEVTEFRDGFDHPIVVETEENDRESYDIRGKRYETDAYPSLFLTNPFEQQGKWMMVSDCPIDEINKGVKRFVFAEKQGKFISWDSANTEAEVLEAILSSNWKYAKEIIEPTQVELTLEQIAEKFGCDVNQLKIKK